MNYFKKSEFSCPCCGGNKINEAFTSKLDEARSFSAVPFRVNSGYRCETHNKHIGGKETSSHVKGLAADIKATTSHERHEILQALFKVGFTRIGIAKNFVHVDLDDDKAHELTWLY